MYGDRATQTYPNLGIGSIFELVCEIEIVSTYFRESVRLTNRHSSVLNWPGWPEAVKSGKFWNICERNFHGSQDRPPIQTVKLEFILWLSYSAKGSQKHENRKERVERRRL